MLEAEWMFDVDLFNIYNFKSFLLFSRFELLLNNYFHDYLFCA